MAVTPPDGTPSPPASLTLACRPARPAELEARPTSHLTCLTTSPRAEDQPAGSLPGTPDAPAASDAPTSSRRRRPLAAPAAFCSGEFTAAPVFADHEAEVSRLYAGLAHPAALKQAVLAAHPGVLEALAASADNLTPPTAALQLAWLEAELPPLLTDVAPGGNSVLAAVSPGLAPLLDRAADCCEAALDDRQPARAAAIALAALSLASRLRFGCGASAAPYASAAMRCKQALKAAYDAGADITEEDIVRLYTSCARASPWLWLTPYAGHRAADAVDAFVTNGWKSAEYAIRICEAYATLTAAGRYAQHVRGFVRLVQAALRHPLSLHQARRLLDAADRLPVEMRIALDLHARSEPDADWHSQLVAIHRLREIEGAYPVPRQQPAALQAADAALHAARKRAAEGRAAEGAPAPALPCHLQYTAGGSGSHRTAGCW